MQRQRHACTGRHARRGTGGDSTGGEQGGIKSGDGGPTREERSVEGGDMGSTRVVGDVEGEGVVTTGGEGGVGGIEYSDADREEEERVRKFCIEGCGGALNSTPCSMQFTIEHFREMRGNAAELSWSEQNMSVMSQIMARDLTLIMVPCRLQTCLTMMAPVTHLLQNVHGDVESVDTLGIHVGPARMIDYVRLIMKSPSTSAELYNNFLYIHTWYMHSDQTFILSF